LHPKHLKSGAWWTGLALALAVSVAGAHSAEWLGTSLLGFERSPISAIMMAIVLGMIFANSVVLPPSMMEGLRFCSGTVLRTGIMLLGIRLSLASAGKNALLATPFVAVAIAVGLITVAAMGRRMGVRRPLAGLIAVGTAICGATAIVATAPLIRPKEEEVGYAIACVTVFGLAAMFIYPVLGHYLFPAEPGLAGLFLGTSIHETAQVAGAGMMYQAQYDAPVALDIATVTKLVRNLFMIVVIPLVGVLYAEEHLEDTHPRRGWLRLVPWFIVGFAAMSALRTTGEFGTRPFGVLAPAQWDAVVGFLQSAAEYLLLLAMAAVGLTSRLSSMRQIGPKPFLLGLFAAAVVGGVSLAAILTFGHSLAQGLAAIH
jgi:uncharacterized integral membrane protein (TIGR00698 family)